MRDLLPRFSVFSGDITDIRTSVDKRKDF